jgi:hypothetical protein
VFQLFINLDVFLKELQPLFDKFTTYFDETITNFELNAIQPTISNQHSTINLDLPILKENLLLNSMLYTGFFKTFKRHIACINDICKLIGSNRKLYEYTITSLTSLYIKTHDWFYSTLKSQLLIKLSEMHNNEALMNIVTGSTGDATGEMVFKFSNLINLCLKERKIEAKRAKELETIMESKKFEKILTYVNKKKDLNFSRN